MKNKLITIFVGIVSTMVFTGCSYSDYGTDTNSTDTNITVVDGYVKDATVTDSTGLIGTYTSNGVYTFSSSPTYPITTTGGELEDTNASFDINMSVSDGVTTVISPITTFLGTDSTLLSKFSGLGLGISTLDEFSIDYVSTNDTNLSKLSQILYLILKDTTLTTTFETSVSNSSSLSSLDDVFTLANTDINASSTLSAQEIIRMNAMLTAVDSYSGTSANLETSINAYKSNLLTESTTAVTHNGLSYGTVISPHTGETWLDRNIGASQTCTSATDTSCYGDYYQWGRNTDGHESNTSSTTTTQASVITSVGSLFIKQNIDWTSADSARTLRAANWAATDGSSVCPSGYRVPTVDEIEAETTDLTGTYAVSNATDVFNGFLSLPSAGYRVKTDVFTKVGTGLSVQTTSLGTTSTTIKTFDADASSASIYPNSDIPYGITVRCIQN